MSELIKRQDAINAVAQLYKYESDRMTALQEVPVITETEIRNNAIDEFAKRLKNKLVVKYGNATPIEQYVALQVTDWCNEIADQMKGGE